MIDEMDEDKRLALFLSSFLCTKDEDVQHFLHVRAIEFEKLSKSRTYLVLDQDELKTAGITDITIYGYIAIALKVLAVSTFTSNRVRKELDGLSGKIHGSPIDTFPCYLIGQLGRNSNIPHEVLSGKELLEFSNSIIADAVDAVGGRYMMIECKPSEKLISFYQSNGYHEISRIEDGGTLMVQMIRKI